MDLAAFDWTIYWFMFPVSIVIATTAMLSGIGGAAMFAPIFMIIFPMLGPDYPFPSIAAAIGVALFTETFGFSSGFVGYFRKGLIDFKSALPFIAVGVPIGIVGAILLTSFKDFEEVLRGSYAVLMLVLAAMAITGCSDPTIDASSEAKMKESVAKVRESLPEAKRTDFDQAVQLIAFSQIDMKSLFANGGADAGDVEGKMRDALNGKTAEQVLAQAEQIQAERKAREKEQALAEIRERQTGI